MDGANFNFVSKNFTDHTYMTLMLRLLNNLKLHANSSSPHFTYKVARMHYGMGNCMSVM